MTQTKHHTYSGKLVEDWTKQPEDLASSGQLCNAPRSQGSRSTHSARCFAATLGPPASTRCSLLWQMIWRWLTTTSNCWARGSLSLSADSTTPRSCAWACQHDPAEMAYNSLPPDATRSLRVGGPRWPTTSRLTLARRRSQTSSTECLDADGATLADASGTHVLQRVLVVLAPTENHASHEQTLATNAEACRESSEGPGVGAFLIYPKDANCSMGDVFWQTALRMRLAMPRPEYSQHALPSATNTCQNKCRNGDTRCVALDASGFRCITCPCYGAIHAWARLAADWSNGGLNKDLSSSSVRRTGTGNGGM